MTLGRFGLVCQDSQWRVQCRAGQSHVDKMRGDGEWRVGGGWRETSMLPSRHA